MDCAGGRKATITQLQQQIRKTGSFVDRAIVREMKISSELFAEGHAAWADIRELADHWEKGASDVKILDAIRWINRSASCWKTRPRRNSNGAEPSDLLPESG